jgi:hypothetical protein
MASFKKPKSFRLSSPSVRKKFSWVRWLFLFLFLGLILGVGFFLRYGFSYLGRFSAFFGGFEEEETGSSVLDTLPPAPPMIDPLPEATNSAILEATGRAEASSELSLFLGKETIAKTVIGDGGDFKVGDIKLEEGKNVIFALAADMAGNISQESVRQTIILDKIPPKLEIDFPENGQSFSQDEREIVIKGKTEDDAVITVNERKIVVDLEGNFEATYSLADGMNSIIIIAKDKAGNQTKEEFEVNYRP